MTRIFANKSPEAKAHAEMLGLMVNDPAIAVDELAKINVPTLVIAGTNDMVKESHTRLIADHIKNAKLCLIQGNHFIANKNSDAFNAAVLAFLKA